MWKILVYDLSFEIKMPWGMARDFIPNYTIFQIIKGKIEKCILYGKEKHLDEGNVIYLSEVFEQYPYLLKKPNGVYGDEMECNLIKVLRKLEKFLSVEYTGIDTDELNKRIYLISLCDRYFKMLKYLYKIK